MNRVRFILAILFAIALSSVKAEERPNVLFIAVDDWNDWVGCLGHEQAITPNVDALAERGVLFINAHCTVSVCNPSRAAIMSGLRPETTGVFENAHRLRKKVPDLVTLPQHFRMNGYRAEGGGKIYHDVPPFCDDPDSWDDYFWWSEHGARGGKVAGGGFRSPYSIPPDPEPESRPTRKITKLTKRNFDWGVVDQPESDWPDYQVAEWASEFLSREQEQPFFLAVGIFRPHVPWFNPQKYVDLYPEDAIELPAVKEDDIDDLGDWAKKRAMDRNSKHADVVEAGEWRGAVQAYLASISHADANVGRVIDALDSGPNKDNTIIAFWSDHGYHLGEKGHWHKRTLWERATHVPLIVVAPGVAESGGRCARPVNLIDLYPTLVELCGVPGRRELAGNSLVPLLKNPESEWPHPSITTYLPGNHALRTERWRYIRYQDGAEELYDHETDPDEWDNLASDPDHRPVVEELSAQLEALVSQ